MTSTAAPLFQAKFTPPPVRAKLIARPQLQARLNMGIERKLTLVSAPAGYGKTSLLVEWAQAAPQPVAWLTLDAEYNDPVRFTACIRSALDSVIHTPTWPSQAVLADLSPQLALQRIGFALEEAPGPVALVLDDYHVLQDPDIHQAVGALIERQPPHLHLFIATRKDQPIPLASCVPRVSWWMCAPANCVSQSLKAVNS